jgi:hypothetical protein
MEFTNLQYEGINLGRCGAGDLGFLHSAGVSWPELTDMIMGMGRLGRRSRSASAYPLGQPYVDQGNNQEEEQEEEE